MSKLYLTGCPSMVQVHIDLLNLDEERFLAQYPVGTQCRIELTVRVRDQKLVTEVSPQVDKVN